MIFFYLKKGTLWSVGSGPESERVNIRQSYKGETLKKLAPTHIHNWYIYYTLQLHCVVNPWYLFFFATNNVACYIIMPMRNRGRLLHYSAYRNLTQ